MTTSEFIKVNKTGKRPQFKELVGLVKSDKTSTLIDFCTHKHPNADKVSQNGKCTVYLIDKTYIYRIYNGFILETNIDTKSRKLYKL